MFAGASFAPDIVGRNDFKSGATLLGPVSCYLCGASVDSEEALWDHLKVHATGPQQTADRLLEEYRKRVLFHEESAGPFPVSGPEIRRAASNHMWHSTHSYLNGNNVATYVKKAANGQERGLGTCVICARSMWKEELVAFNLFTQPVEGFEHEGSTILGIAGNQVLKVDELLSAHVYSERWPKIPKRELLGTSVRHPFLKDAMWLLDIKAMSSMLNEDRSVKLDAEGRAPLVKVCRPCAFDLNGSQVTMPAMALANDNLMLRPPCVFQDDMGQPLSDATLLLLALARAVVIKEVAEPLRQVPGDERQKVLKGNAIALPQADCRVLATQKLPGELNVLRPFLRENLAVVFCGKDLSEADRFPKLEVDWKKYVDAARFLIAHNPHYEHVEVDEEAAKAMFGGCGIPSIIKELITVLNVEEEFRQPEGAAVDA